MDDTELTAAAIAYAAVLAVALLPLIRSAGRGPASDPVPEVPFPLPGSSVLLLGIMLLLTLLLGLGTGLGPLLLVPGLQLALLAGFQQLLPRLPGPAFRYRPAFWTWLLATPVVFAVFALTKLVFPDGEVHPLIQEFKDSPTAVRLAIACRAVLLAPLIEEWFFRGFLLPWQLAQSNEAKRANVPESGTEVVFFTALLMMAVGKPGPAPLLAVAVGYSLMTGAAKWRWLRNITGIEPCVVRAVFANAVLFAAIHSNVWPTPIPLFVLGLALAGLAARCRSFWPSFIVHSLFNAISTLMLFLA